MRSIKVTAFFSFLMIVAAPAVAQAQQGPSPLRLLLRAHHDAPSVEVLRQVADDPIAALLEVARDESELTLVRRRAVVTLAFFPGARSEGILVELLDGSEGELRRASALALTTLLSERDPRRLVTLLSRLLESSDPLDREAAVWLLDRVDTDDARRRLARQRIVERHRAVVDALRRVSRGAIGQP